MKKQILISCTDYIDFVSNSMTKKISKVVKIMSRGKYDPAHDFYKGLRDKIITYFKFGGDKSDILDYIDNDVNIKKVSHYRKVSDGLLKLLKRHKLEWINPISGVWNFKELNVRINPEVGLAINGNKYFVKLYFKESPLETGEAQIIIKIMNDTLCKGLFTGYKCAVLDLRNAKLHKEKDLTLIKELIEGEAELFLKIWYGKNKMSA